MKLFAAFVLEQEFASLRDLPEMLPVWLRLVGLISLAFLVIIAITQTVQSIVRGKGRILLDGVTGKLANVPADEAWKVRPYWLALMVTGAGMVLTVTCFIIGKSIKAPDGALQAESDAKWVGWTVFWFTTMCAAAIVSLSWEMFVDLVTFSPRRIWAVARLSFKEAIHRKALWSFVVLLAIFLFASWFIQAPRPEDQWRTYVGLVFFVMTALMLITASTLACFSIPNDIKNQTIHTIVTKPVHKFEVVLGRIIGFTLLMSVVLFVVAHLSLLYVFRGINEQDRPEVMRARVTHSGQLHFEGLNDSGQWVPKIKGTIIGREWEYRQYIAGGAAEEAIWTFENLPASLQEMERIFVEFDLDIFRTTKGGEDYKEGVSCQFTFVNPDKWQYSPDEYAAYRQAVEADPKVRMSERDRAEKFGYYELPSPITIVDYKTFTINFPGSLLRGSNKLSIRVACRTPSQYLGMAKHDLYLVTGEGSFYLNFLKSTSGIWFVMAVMVTLGVVFSTYLNALVSLLLTWMLMLCGLPRLRSYVLNLSSNNPDINPGGGPMEAFIRTAKREGITQPLEENMMKKLLAGGGNWYSVDDIFRIFFRGFHDVLPNLGQYDRMMFLAEGFNIPFSDLLMSLLLMAGYLFPFFVAGYYLLSTREIAQ